MQSRPYLIDMDEMTKNTEDSTEAWKQFAIGTAVVILLLVIADIATQPKTKEEPSSIQRVK